MSDRTVAEVMGWVELAAWGWHRPGCSDEPWEHVCCCRCGPTPDDMLSWLSQRNERTWSPFWIEPVWGISGVSRYRVKVVVEGRPGITEEAPTLHAALEAAVLAVSAAQDVEQQGDDGEDDQNGGQHA